MSAATKKILKTAETSSVVPAGVIAKTDPIILEFFYRVFA